MDASLTNVVYAGRTVGGARAYVRMTHEGDPRVPRTLPGSTAQHGARVGPASRIARETGVRSAQRWSQAMEHSLKEQLRELLIESRAQRRRALGRG